MISNILSYCVENVGKNKLYLIYKHRFIYSIHYIFNQPFNSRLKYSD